MDRWEYLTTPVYQVRHAIAAHFVQKCAAVVDVGAYRVPLNVPGTLYSVDPLATIDGAHHCTVSEFWRRHNDLRGFGLVVLGLDITGDGEIETIRAMMNAASVTVLEWSATHPLGVQQAAYLMRDREPVVTMALRLPTVRVAGFPVQGDRRLAVINV